VAELYLHKNHKSVFSMSIISKKTLTGKE